MEHTEIESYREASERKSRKTGLTQYLGDVGIASFREEDEDAVQPVNSLTLLDQLREDPVAGGLPESSVEKSLMIVKSYACIRFKQKNTAAARQYPGHAR